MVTFITTLKGTAAMIGTAVGGVLLAEGAVGAIGNETPVTIGLMGLLVTGAWYLSGTLRGIKDQQRQTNKRLSRIEMKLKISEADDLDTDFTT